MAAVAAFLVTNFRFRSMMETGLSMGLGTAIGLFFGYWIAGALAGNPVGQTLFLFVGMFLAILARFAPSRFAMGLSFATLMPTMLVLMSLAAPQTTYLTAWSLFYATAFGVLSAALFSALAVGFLNPFVPETPPPTSSSGSCTALPETELVALVGAVTLLVAVYLWVEIELPSISEICITIALTIDRDVVSGRIRRIHRLLGCAAGAALGLGFAALGLHDFILWSLVLVTGLALFGAVFHLVPAWSYFGQQGALALIMTLVVGSGPPDTVMPAVDRFSGIFAAVLLMIALRMVLRRPMVALFERISGSPSAARDIYRRG